MIVRLGLFVCLGMVPPILAADTDRSEVVVSDVESLRKALQGAGPGTTIRIAPGSYRGWISARGLKGEAGRPIVVKADDAKNPPVIEGEKSGIHLASPAYVELHDLVVRGVGGNGINIDNGGSTDTPAHHVILKGIVVQDVGPKGNRDGIKLSGVDDFVVEGCTVERWGDGGSGIDMVGCHRGEITNGTFRHGDRAGDNGVQTKGGSSEIVIRRCRFEHAGQRAINIGGSTGAAFFRPPNATYEAKDITVEDCTILGSMAPLAFVGVDGAIVRHNTIYRPAKWGLRILQENRTPGLVPCRNGQIIDNLIAFRSDEMSTPVNISDATAPETFVLARNAWFCLDRPDRSRPKLPTPEVDGEYGEDPGFRDPDNGDLRTTKGKAGVRVSEAAPAVQRPRVVVLTDISSLVANEAEPDDGQSMIRFMLNANEFDIEGLFASSNLGHGQKVRPELIHTVVNTYEKVHSNLLAHDPRYPPADRLRATIKAGQPIAGPEVPVEQSVGEGKDTEASDSLIAIVDRADPRPVWVLIWGGSADLAQSLWKVRASRSPEDLDRFLAKIRVISIGDQDSTGPWIRDQFASLRTITQRRAYRGMYRGGDTSLSSSDWVKQHIHGHGPLGDLYPNYRGGDIWSGTLGPVRGIKEGDTPSFLTLVPNGLFDPEHPGLGSWGGRFEGPPERLTDVADKDLDTTHDPDPRMSSVYRWRPAFQADFQARLDWCVKPFAGANHPPIVRVRGEASRTLKPGAAIILDASESTDPDGDPLTFDWSVYPVGSQVEIEGQGTSTVSVKVPPGHAGPTIPVLLSVRDGGTPRLTRYRRVLLQIAE